VSRHGVQGGFARLPEIFPIVLPSTPHDDAVRARRCLTGRPTVTSVTLYASGIRDVRMRKNDMILGCRLPKY
jgi:hypothetical protein